jgi:hypothetical protein
VESGSYSGDYLVDSVLLISGSGQHGDCHLAVGQGRAQIDVLDVDVALLDLVKGINEGGEDVTTIDSKPTCRVWVCEERLAVPSLWP